MTHGAVPEEMRLSTVSPIPKNKRKSLNDSENYRAIALSSIIGKLLDKVLICKCQQLTQTSPSQFGFKAQHSTMHCGFVARETISYYHSKNSDVYITLLDASKAFDRVEYTCLFNNLIDKGICPIVVRFLLRLYTSQTIRVRWGGSHTEAFTATNGVKQGGVLSPLLFSIYLDPLLHRLEDLGKGCWVGATYIGALAFADDVILLSPTVHALKCQLRVCEDYAREYSVSFNTSKSKLIPMQKPCARPNGTLLSVRFMGDVIETTNCDKHLGLVLGNTANEDVVNAAIRDFNIKSAMLRAHFKWLSPPAMYQLFKSHCMPLYGSVLWDLAAASTSRFYVAWRKAVRLLLQLPPRTHSSLLPPLCKDLEPRLQILLRFAKFVRSLSSSPNPKVQQCLAVAVGGSSSAFSHSLSAASERFSIPRHMLSSSAPASSCTVIEENPDAAFLSDLLCLRHHQLTRAYPARPSPNDLSLREINDLILYIATR